MGVLAVIVVYAVATVLFVPGSVLTIGAGFAFGASFNDTAKGVALASLAVFVGAFLGSVGSFLLGRYLFRDFVVQLASRYAVFQAVDKALEGNGLKIMILLRLSPLIPYNALDYISGITSISFRTYCLGLLAILPGVVMFTFVGATASSLLTSHDEASNNQTARIFSLVFGITFAVIGVLMASYYSKIELDKDVSGKMCVCVFGITFAVIGVLMASYYSKIELDKILEAQREQSYSTPLNSQNRPHNDDEDDDQGIV
eukprot:CAMPEP_0116577050 /NCGR_PEP_ID=MMETSP0397-20121206/20898_1 /TAXON_ID=216820 /ORGANISM="Cyclophora tenuis, Strain ECT3854" /LENGTH=256 /DNA_ID=CAMNT_0004106211 /DNA_START=95 /DNA_END=866 /DNA_ORIENTATION=+